MHLRTTNPIESAFATVRPGLRFTVYAILGFNHLVAVVGSVGQPRQSTDSPGRLIWLVRIVDGLMAEMWTCRQNPPSR